MKSNPSKQDLIDFTNQITFNDIDPIQKIQELSTGTHYLLLLHQIFPTVVKISKINLKAFHQYESINNLKTLAVYISELKAPFTFQLTKIAQKNYQDNLNLIKNLYKFFYDTQMKRQNKKEELPKNVKKQLDAKNAKSKPKIVLKGPPKEKPKERKSIKKDKILNKSTENIISEPSEQIKKIIKIIQTKKDKKVTAQAKIKQIQQLLKDDIKQNKKPNFSVKCSGSKSARKQSNQFEIDQPKLPIVNNLAKTEGKILNTNQNIDSSFNTELKKLPPTFNCQQLKQSMFKKYELRPTSSRKKAQQNRKSRNNLDLWFKQEQEDTRFNENLLSPRPQNDQIKQQTSSRRKSIIVRNSQNSYSLSKRKSSSVNMLVSSKKSVHFSPKRISQRRSQNNSSHKSLNKKKDSEVKAKQVQNSKLKSVRS